MIHRTQVLVSSLALCAALAAPLAAADAPAAGAAPAPTATAPAPQPAVNEDYLQKAIGLVTTLSEACKANGAVSKLGGMLGGAAPAAGDDKAKLAQGLLGDLQTLKAGKTPPADGPFQQLVVKKKDGIATAFKGVPGADKLQAAFGDGSIGKALLAATPVDQVPGYQKAADALGLPAKK